MITNPYIKKCLDDYQATLTLKQGEIERQRKIAIDKGNTDYDGAKRGNTM